MAERPEPELVEREELFARLSRAYEARDFPAIDRALREDVVLHIPGTSPFAGEHHGQERVGRLVLGLRQFLDPEGRPIRYAHEGDVMIATQTAVVHGPKHLVEMEIRVSIRFDTDGRVENVFVQPSDVGLFDHVIGAAMLDSAIGP